MAASTFVAPEVRQWVGVARELSTGTPLLPVATVPVDKGEPDDKPTFLDDKGMRGSMTDEYGVIEGTEIGEFDPSGNVYLDTIGFLLHNAMGDYLATGSSPASASTLTAPVAAGATTCTVTSGTGYTVGASVQLDVSTNAEVVVLTAVSTNTLTFTNTPARLAHASGVATAVVIAPFTHVFSLLNSGDGQPPTHTLTHYQGLAGTFGANQYASWCCSGLDFTMDAEQLFKYSGKGQSYIKQIAAAQPVNTISAVKAQPGWQFLVGIGGPAASSTQAFNVCSGGVSIARTLKPYFTATGAQNPYTISRAQLNVTGKFTQLAQDESPMLNMINNVQPQLQIKMVNGTGASTLAITFDIQVGAYDAVKLTGSDMLEYDVSWKAVANTTNAGYSGGFSPMKVTVENAVPTY